MMDLIRANMAPLMFGGLVLFMLIGYPAAFSLSAVGLFFGIAALQLHLIEPEFLGNLAYQLYGVLSNDLLLAVPFFTLMGVILERSGLAEDLLEGFGQLFGGVRGGLSYAVIFVGAIMGAITGTVAASVISMGLISLPVMMRYGYSVRHATGVIAASGTIAQLIPPSLVLIVLASQLGQSAGTMYVGATGASIVQVLLFAAWVLVLSVLRPKAVPALPPEARTLRGWALAAKLVRGMVPSLALIFVVLGTIFLGLVTPTEAGAMGVVGALILAAFNRRLTWPMLWDGMVATMRLTSMVIFILLGSRVFSLVFQGVGGSHWIESLLVSLPGGQTGFLLFTMAAVGLPGTSGFVGEFLSMMGTYAVSTWGAIFATTGIILGAAYMLYLYWRIAYGVARTAEAKAMPDLSRREWALLAPIAAVVLWMGVYPESFLAPMRKDVGLLLTRVERAAPAGDSRPTAGNPAAAAQHVGSEGGAEAAH